MVPMKVLILGDPQCLRHFASKHEHESAHHTTEDNKETIFATKAEGEGLDTGRSNALA